MPPLVLIALLFLPLGFPLSLPFPSPVHLSACSMMLSSLLSPDYAEGGFGGGFALFGGGAVLATLSDVPTSIGDPSISSSSMCISQVPQIPIFYYWPLPPHSPLEHGRAHALGLYRSANVNFGPFDMSIASRFLSLLRHLPNGEIAPSSSSACGAASSSVHSRTGRRRR